MLIGELEQIYSNKMMNEEQVSCCAVLETELAPNVRWTSTSETVTCGQEPLELTIFAMIFVDSSQTACFDFL